MPLEPSTVFTFGEMRSFLYEGDTSPNVELGTLLRSGPVGVGALSRLCGGVTIDGSTPWMFGPVSVDCINAVAWQDGSVIAFKIIGDL